MASETESVALQFAGNFVAAANDGASAAVRLATGLDQVAGSADKVKSPPALKTIQKDADAAARSVNLLSKALSFSAKAQDNAFSAKMKEFASKGTPRDLMPKTGAGAAPPGNFSKLVGGVGRLFGGDAAAGLVKGASFLSGAGEKLQPFAPLLSMGSGALKAAGGVVLGAAQAILVGAGALAAAGVAVGAAGIKFAIDKTSEKELQSKILGKLGGTFDLPMKLAMQFGLDEGKSIEMVKGLLGAKFKQTEVPALVRIAVGIGAVKGEGKAAAFLEKLESTAAKGGKASEDSIKGFAEAGINVDKVWAALAKKLGVSVEKAKGKVKANSVDMKTALEAVKEAGSADFGGIADTIGSGVPAKLGKIGILFGSMFNDVDLGPLKGVLDNVAGVLEGGTGAELKGAIKELFSAFNTTFLSQFQGAEGKAKIADFVRDAVGGMRELAGTIRSLEPTVRVITTVGMAAASALPDVMNFLLLPVQTAQSTIQMFKEVGAAIESLLGTTESAKSTAESGGTDIGSSLVSGITNAILGGQGGAISSIIGMVTSMIGGGRAAADAHSPSRKMGELGGDMVDGQVGAVEGGQDRAAAAGAKLADATAGGAAKGGAGGKGKGAGAAGEGGGEAPMQIIMNFAPGTTPGQAQAASAAAGEEWRRQRRMAAREAA